MTALLQDRGISARFVDLSEIINFQVACELDREFYQKLTATLSEEVRVCGDQIPVLTGYWGSVPGELTLEKFKYLIGSGGHALLGHYTRRVYVDRTATFNREQTQPTTISSLVDSLVLVL